MNKLLVGCGAAAVVFGVIACSLILWLVNSYNTAIRQETALNAQYQTNQTGYSEFNAGLQEQWGAVLVSYQGLDKILSDAVKGRYDTQYNPETGAGSGVMNTQFVVKAIAEAYPDLSGQTDLITKIMDYIQGKRTGFKNGQDKLIDMLRTYDAWRKQMPQSLILGIMGGSPTNTLEVRVGTQVFRGQAGLDQMYLLVLTSDTVEAFTTGVDTPFVPSNPFAEPTATTPR